MSGARQARKISVRNGHQKMLDAGFTLLEVMLAVSIIAIVLVSTYKMQAQTISMNYMSKYQTTAALLAQQKMAEVETTRRGSLISDSGDFGDAFKGYSWSISVEEVNSEFFGEAAADLKKVDVTITLNQDEGVFRVSEYRYIRD